MSITDDLTSGASTLVSELLSASDDILKGLMGLPGLAFESIMNALFTFRYLMVYYFSEALKYADGIGLALKEFVTGAFTGVYSAINQAVITIKQFVLDRLSSLSDSILGTVNNMIASVKKLISNIANSLTDFKGVVTGLFGAVNVTLNSIVEVLFNPDLLFKLIESTLLAVW